MIHSLVIFFFFFLLAAGAQALLVKCPAPSPQDTLPSTMCCSNVTQQCNLTSSYVAPLVLNVTSLVADNATLTIGAKQTLSIGGTFAEGQPSFFSGSIVVKANGTLWVGRVAFTVGGKLLSFEAGSTLRITGNGTILLGPQTCLALGKNVTLIIDVDAAGNETTSIPIIQTASNESALCLSAASEATTFDPINASYTVIEAQSGALQLVWTSLGTGCTSYSALAAVFTSAGCPAPPPPVIVVGSNLSFSPSTQDALSSDPAPEANGLWIITGVVMGVVFLALVTAGLLFVYNPRFRRALAPFRDRAYFVPSVERTPRVSDRRGGSADA